MLTIASEAFADFEIKLAKQDVELEVVLNHQAAMNYFTRFVESEFNGELINVRFNAALIFTA